MTTLGVAEAFYGDMYGNEAYLTDHNIAIRKSDGELWIATYRDSPEELLTPNYHIKASAGDKDYLSELRHKVEITEPSILIAYGEKFLALLAATGDFPALLKSLNEKDSVCVDRYPEFKGYIGTYRELKEINQELADFAESKLYEFFDKGTLEEFSVYRPYFELWKSTADGYFSETSKIALETAYSILLEPEREDFLLRVAEIHCEHNETADHEQFLVELSRLLQRKF